MSQTIHFFEGGNALSDFRLRRLLPKLQAVLPTVTDIAARVVHVAAFDGAPAADALQRVAALLTYGAPYVPPADGAALTLVVAPRLGTVSPWASKATDIARNCGIALHRVERIV
ncbi:MAG: hypothetical protein LBU72_05885, partial [Burkholderiaceae bacterium]|nr:hypothetical protein [Burkholderiaceae bacterium]